MKTPEERLDEAFRLAIERFQAGAMDDVMRLCDGLLAAVPGHPVVLNLMAAARHQMGQHAAALDLVERSLAAAPAFADALNTKGVVLRALGRLDEAVQAHRQATEVAPAHLLAHLNLAAVLNVTGDHEGALKAAQRVLALDPNSVLARSHAGVALRRLDRVPEAIAMLRGALAVDPMLTELHVNLGNALLQAGEAEEAEKSFRRALIIDPNDVDALNNLGNILLNRGRVDEAAHNFQQAITLAPHHTEALGNLGVAQLRQGRHAAAIATFRHALAAAPGHTELFPNLGAALQLRRQLDQALSAHAAGVLMGDSATRLKAASNLLYALQLAGLDAARLGALHRALGRLFDTGAVPPPAEGGGKRLRIGLVSADFARHPVGFFTQAYGRHADRQAVEVFGYSLRAAEDDVTADLRANLDHWYECHGWTDDRLEAQIRVDRIDILVDLAGHTADNRLPVFARHPAPVQASWAGYVGTTGLAAMDWLVADANHVPEAEDAHCSERVMRLPDDYIVYTPPADLPELGPLPARAAGRVTFGCFNNAAKISDRAIALWSRVLAAVPDSTLLLRTHGLDDATLAGEVIAAFAAHGIAADRLVLEGGCRHAELLASYGRVDVALDSLPYSGGLTTCEALWMGVPVVTLRGNSFAARHSAGHLTAAGLAQWVAEDEDSFVAIAAGLAGDLEALAEIRAGLRARVAASPLGDGPRFARALDETFARMWQAAPAQAPSAAPPPAPRHVAIVTIGDDESLVTDVMVQTHPCHHVPAASFAEGAERALAEGADALLFAGPGARLLPDHVQSLLGAGAPVATCGRIIMGEPETADPLDTAPECVLLRGPAVELARVWSQVPPELAGLATRIYRQAVVTSPHRRVHLDKATAAVPRRPLPARAAVEALDSVPTDSWLRGVFPFLW